MRQRVLKYFVPVTFLSFVFTIPKFFESQVEYADEGFFEDAHVYEDNITSVHSGIFFKLFYKNLVLNGWIQFWQYNVFHKVEKILKGSLDSIPSPSASMKI